MSEPMARPSAAPNPDVDLAALYRLAGEIDATRGLVGTAARLQAEIERRIVEFRGQVDRLNGDDPGAPPGPTKMDRLVDLSGICDLEEDFRRLVFDGEVFLAEDLYQDPPYCYEYLAQLIDGDHIDRVVDAYRAVQGTGGSSQ